MPRDFDVLHAYWHSLADGAVPDHDLVEPDSVLELLPYLMIVEFEEQPFRVRYRLSGSKLDYVSNLDLTGRYLDEFAVEVDADGKPDVNGPRNQAVAILSDLYAACRDRRKPVYGHYEWPDKKGYLWQVEVAIFPLLVQGEVRQCLALEYYGFDTAHGPEAPAIDPRLPVFD